MDLEKRARFRPALRITSWVICFGAVVILLQSAFWTPRVPWQLQALLLSVALIAAVRPADGLLAVAGLAPFGYVIVVRVWNDLNPFALTEAIMLAFFAGYLWHERRRAFQAPAESDGLATAARLFVAVVLASGVVQLAILQVWHDTPARYASTFFTFLVRDYLTTIPDQRFYADGRRFVSIAALLVEGVALLLVTRTLCRQNAALATRLIHMVVIVGAAAAVLGLYEALGAAIMTNDTIWEVTRTGRWSTPIIPSVNTSGTYFLFMTLLAAAAAVSSRRWTLPGLVAAGLCLAMLWLTRTRSGIVPGLAVVSAILAWLAAQHLRIAARAAMVGAAAIALAIGIYLIVYNPLDILAAGGLKSLNYRAELSGIAFRMMASEPITGVGIGQYPMRYPQFASPEWIAAVARNDAHNYFLWVGAELGVFGLAIFLWLIVAALRPGWNHVRLHRTDYRFLLIMTSLTAFIITWIAGQPLAVPQVACTFWIVLGLATAANRSQNTADVRALPRSVRWTAAVGITLIIAMLPLRARFAREQIDLTNVKYGFFHSSRIGNRPFRWAGPYIRFHMRSSERRINMPIAVRHPDMPHGANIDISVDGRLLQRLTLTDRVFHDVRIDAPASAQPIWRVELHVDPIGLDSNSDSLRRIAVGEITVVEVATPVQRASPDVR